MRIIETANQMQSWGVDRISEGDSIGFVPTQGCLHEGHASLLHRARTECDRVVLSVFVNPLQFRKPAYEDYPRRVDSDLKIADECGVDAAFVPSITSIYPYGLELDELFSLQSGDTGPRHEGEFTSDAVGTDNSMNYVRVPDRLVMRMDGKGYPWHFDGVATVVRRLFEIVNPTKAYFGQKDIQQLAILDSMNQWLNTGIDIVQVPIYRDADGLSSSSRLTLLDPDQRAIAIKVTQIINQHSKQSGQRAKAVLESLKNALHELSDSEDQLEVDAVECINPKSLDPAMVIGQNSALYVAFVINGLRLAETRWCK